MSAFRYNVRVTVGDDLAERFSGYMLSKHIPDVLATGKFVSAELARSETGAFLISYLAAKRPDLEEYLEEHTERLRDSFAKEFPFEVRVEREILEVLDAIDAG